MTGQPAYARVVHLDVAADGGTNIDLSAGSRALVVLWRDDRPVGQVRIEPEDDAAARVREAIAALADDPGPAGQCSPALGKTVSLVICTRDRPDQLARCLASLGSQERRPDEVIVVDNASRDDRTRRAAEAAGVRYVREDRPGLDIARNTGLLAATTEIVAYTDDDTELHPRWLACLTAAFDDEQVMAVTGLVLPATLDTEAQWLFETHWGFGRGYSRIDFGPDFYTATRATGTPAWEVGAGANMAFRREVADRIGLFDERLDVGASGCSGDSEYWYRLLAAGWTCRYEPSAVVLHHHRRDMEGFRSQIFHYMRGHVSALLVQHERTGDRGNLRRIGISLPRYYAGRLKQILRHGRRPGDEVLGREVLGSLAGIAYYGRARLRGQRG